MDESTSPGNAAENPFHPPGSPSGGAAPAVRREGNTTLPRTIGLLNIIFGGLLCVCGVGYGLYMIATMFMGPMMQAQQGQMKAAIEGEWANQLQDLRDQEAAAESDEDKAFFKDRRETLQANPPEVPDMSSFMNIGQDPRMVGYWIVDVLSGLLFNVLFIASGAGLLGLKEWGRRLAVWIAGLKLVRLFLLTVYVIVVVIPLAVRALTKMMESAAPRGGGPGMNPARAASALSIMYSAMFVALLLFGAVYPIVVLIGLTRERVKIACQGTVLSE